MTGVTQAKYVFIKRKEIKMEKREKGLNINNP